MDRKEYCYKLADMNERLFDIENELKEIKIKIIMEDNSERKEWFINAQDKLLKEKEELETIKQEFVTEYSSLIED